MNFYKLKEDGNLVLVRGLVTIGALQKNAQFLTVEEAESISAYEKANNSAELREGYNVRRDCYELIDGKWATKWVYEPMSVEELTAIYDSAMEEHLDAEKAARGYTKREPSDYANSTVPRYRQDADDWTKHRDAVMLYGLDILNKAARGEPVPTLSEFKKNLPVIHWTEEQ